MKVFLFSCLVKSRNENKIKKQKKAEAARKRIGTRVRKLREYFDMTQAELSQASDLTVEYISRLENEEKNAYNSTLEQLSTDGFKMKENEFYDYNYFPPKPEKKYSSK